MSKTRSKLLAVAVVTAAALMTMPSANAAPGTTTTPDQYAAQAVASALRVSIFGQGVTIGSATTNADSTPKATASGRGALIATQSFGATDATASKVGQATGSDTPACSPLTLPSAVPLLSLSSACSTAKAAVASSGPSASASGKSIEIDLTGNSALAAIPVDTLTTQLTDTLLGSLPPLVGVFPVPPTVIVDQLTKLLNQAITGQGVKLLTIVGGAASSSTAADGNTVTASSNSTGATIKLLDRSAVGLQPILTITVGNSTTSVSRDRASGATTANETAIPVTVTVAPDVAFLLKLPQSTFSAPEGKEVDLPLPSPLTSSIMLSGGSTSDIKNGKQAQSGSLDLNLLQGLNGGIQIGLSSGSSAVAGTIGTVVKDETTVPATTPPATPTTLPRTGVDQGELDQTALLLGLGALVVGGLVVAAARRNRIAKA